MAIKKWSKKDLALKADIAPSYITLLTKYRNNPTLEIMQKIANAFGVPLAYLLHEHADISDVNKDIRNYYNEKYVFVCDFYPKFEVFKLKNNKK